MRICKDVRMEDDRAQDLDLVKDEDLFNNPERMLWKVVKFAYEPEEQLRG